MKRYTYLIFFIAVLASQCLAQWSTSTFADSALYVCPGFYPGIIIFDDGSSIVLGALQSYIYAQKLDPFGYKRWTQPVQVLYNDSSNITDLQAPYLTEWGGWVSDDSGGVILFWYDHRGGYQDPGSGYWYNNAIYAQRVDGNGVVRWTHSGVRIVGPESGLKYANIVKDGQGGFILAWTEAGFNYPGAPNKQYLRAARYDFSASLLWETAIDSSTVESDSYGFYRLSRGGERLYVNYYANGNFSRIINTEGQIITVSAIPVFGVGIDGDSLAYAFVDTTIYKIGSAGDTLWSIPFHLPTNCQYIGFFAPDGYGGDYFVACGDTISHVDGSGILSEEYFSGISFGGEIYSDGHHGLVAINATTAKRFNQSGQMIWPQPVTYMRDPGNAYFEQSAPDNNGGVIVVFWTTTGGIFGQHTGRYGQVGLVPVMERQGLPQIVKLLQNYPNPFNPSTTVEYSLPHDAKIRIDVFDILGQRIATLIDGYQQAGKYSIKFIGENLSSGVYFYQLKVDDKIKITRKMLLMR